VTDESIEDVRAYCDELQQKGVERVVVRWIDEKRPVHHDEDDGMTIEKVTELTLKSAHDGEVVERTFEGVAYQEVKPMLMACDFEVIERTDNLT
jgi:hypothetical protein